MNQLASAAKKFVVNNKTALVVTAVALTGAYVMRKALEQHNDFLKENDLFEKFHSAE